MKKTIITIVGGGASTYSLIAFLSRSNCEVRLLTSKPDLWSSLPQLKIIEQGHSERIVQGKIDKVSDDYSLLIPGSDIIVLCMPVHQYYNALEKTAPYVDKSKLVYIGTLYGQGGFNWMIKSLIERHNLRSAVYFSIGLLPWICRTEQYGKVGLNYGCKARNIIALSDHEKFEHLNAVFLNDICNRWFGTGDFHLAENFLSLTLSVDNQIIHPTRCYSLFVQFGGFWSQESDIPYFYKDYNEHSAEFLKKLDAEYSLIRQGIRSRYPEKNFDYMLDYLTLERFSYDSDNTDVKESFQNSKTLSKIKPPVIRNGKEFSIDTAHRFFTDDIEYGLCIAKWFATQLNIDTPFIDEIIHWSTSTSASITSLSGGLPANYGLFKLDEAID
ncbi:MAG: NAD/NADP octopine/nopaline dehydrogenase family protein [Candidimonas sp.]|nr:NAD/NADP octopine/nopaline dehydrogenase family protein [Candidimonas sp.]